MPDVTVRHSRVFRSFLLVFILIACGVGGAGFLYVTREELPRREASALPPVVESVVVQLENVTDWLVGYGSARPDRVVTVSSEVSGRIIDRVSGIEAGSEAKQGQPLFRIDDREYLLALERARALAAVEEATVKELIVEEGTLRKLLKTAEHEVRVTGDERKRVSALFEQGSAAKKEFDFANLDYQRARRVYQGYEMELAKIEPRRERVEASKRSYEAQAGLAELNVERCEISAPFTGVIQTLFVEAGDRVAVGAPLMTLVDPSHVEIPIQLPGAAYDDVSVGASCRLKYESSPELLWEGRVARVAPDVDERTRTFSVYLDVDNTRHEKPLVPGTFVTAEVRGPTYGDRLLVPRGAIRDGAVLVAAGNVASRRSVRTERLIGDRALIVGDVHPGDDVIVSHLGQLEDGSPIRLREALSESKQDGDNREHSEASGLGASSEVRVEGRGSSGSPAGKVGVSP